MVLSAALKQLFVFYLRTLGSGNFVVILELVLVLEEELERLLSDGPVGHEADDAHAGRDQEVVDLAFVAVVGGHGDLPVAGESNSF